MAKEITAIYAYTPRVKPGQMVDIDELVSYILARTSFNEGAVMNLLTELRDALRFFVRSGRPVKLKGVGVFGPRIGKDGRFGVTYRADSWLKSELNIPAGYKGDMVNKDMIGKSVRELVERWNEEHPDDPVMRKY